MKYKALFIDLDGTLLCKFKKISRENLQALEKYYLGGGSIVLSTGRSPLNTFKIVDKIESNTKVKIRYVSCFNGAIVYDLEQKKPLFDSKISVDVAKAIYQYALQNKLGFWPYNKRYTDKKIIDILNTNYAFVIKLFYQKQNSVNTKVINDLFDDIYKINIIPSHLFKKHTEEIYNKMKDAFGLNLNLCFTNKHIIEITNLNVNKGTSLKFIANLLNLKKDEIASIGDSFNDVPMFQESAISALARVKNIKLVKDATFIMNKKNNKKSVAKFINNYLLES
ncbi:Cof-type HAD-IIB family hydrolase [Ureaplasma canigenitalium]|uniref:Cof-type HAD-IIB family hydrolase n=1 Tax=Ureaplasma canigenitalium TaxID=42092 RepID=UPI0004E1CECE|nr:Cof-type HAD-IIB family hydrolase [Ureaplasma canigenitalium]